MRCRWSSASLPAAVSLRRRPKRGGELRYAVEGLEKRLEFEETGAYAYDKAVDECLDHELAIINLGVFQATNRSGRDQLGERPLDSRRPGRVQGLAPGSMLRITDLDPLPYDSCLSASSTQSASMPDFYVDFCQERRGEVIQYVTEKYGADRRSDCDLARLGGKSVIKDVASVLDTFAQINEMTRIIPAPARPR